MRIVPTLLLAVVAIAAHAEKKVYKCTNADGTPVFLPDPCGAGAQEMKVDAKAAPEPPAPMPGAEPAPTEAAPRAAPPAPSPPDAEDVKCRQDAERLRKYPAEINLQMLVQRQAELMRTYAAAPSDAGKVQIGNLDATIAAEQARLSEARKRTDKAVANALGQCDARKSARDQSPGAR
jgi:hypothetical protein